MQTRYQKIAFLKGLAKGSRSLTELTAGQTVLFMQSKMNEDAFTGGPTTLHGKDGFVTRAQIDEFSKMNSKVNVLIFTHSNGCEPLEPTYNKVN